MSGKSGRTADIGDKKLASALKKLRLEPELQIVGKPTDVKGGLVSVSMLDRRADLRLNVPLSAFREGLQTKLGDLACMCTAGRVLLHDVPNQKTCNILIIKDKIRILNIDVHS